LLSGLGGAAVHAMSFAGPEIMPATNPGGTSVWLEESFQSGSQPTNWTSHPSGIGYRRSSPGVTTWTGSGSASTSSTGPPIAGNAPTMDSGMADGGGGEEMTRLANFLTGGNENPTSTQPGPTARAIQDVTPSLPMGSPAVTNLLLTDPEAQIPIDAAPFSPSSNGSGIVAAGFGGDTIGPNKPPGKIVAIPNADPNANMSIDASPFDPDSDADFSVTPLVTEMQRQPRFPGDSGMRRGKVDQPIDDDDLDAMLALIQDYVDWLKEKDPQGAEYQQAANILNVLQKWREMGKIQWEFAAFGTEAEVLSSGPRGSWSAKRSEAKPYYMMLNWTELGWKLGKLPLRRDPAAYHAFLAQWSAARLFHEGYHLLDEKRNGHGESRLEELEAKKAELGFYQFFERQI
jgi:hypothetical protein